MYLQNMKQTFTHDSQKKKNILQYVRNYPRYWTYKHNIHALKAFTISERDGLIWNPRQYSEMCEVKHFYRVE